jgi:hypothetical protein
LDFATGGGALQFFKAIFIGETSSAPGRTGTDFGSHQDQRPGMGSVGQLEPRRVSILSGRPRGGRFEQRPDIGGLTQSDDSGAVGELVGGGGFVWGGSVIRPPCWTGNESISRNPSGVPVLD